MIPPCACRTWNGAVAGLGYRLDRLNTPLADHAGDIGDLPKELAHITPPAGSVPFAPWRPWG